jgi:CubicO group peptidase (beta-lactamase class C family)
MVIRSSHEQTGTVIGFRRSLAGVALALPLAEGAACSGEDPLGTGRDQPSHSPVSVTSDVASPTLSDVARQVDETVKLIGGVVTGATVLVRVGESNRLLAAGLGDVKHRRPTRPSDRFPIQSITKAIETVRWPSTS